MPRSLFVFALTAAAACASGASKSAPATHATTPAKTPPATTPPATTPPSTAASAGATSSRAAESARFAPSLGVNLDSMRQTGTGLYIKDIEAGTGLPAITGDFVRIEYTLYLANGTRIDGSEPGQPFEFRLGQGQVIAGWEEGVVGMRTGARRRLVVPARLGYGMRAYNGIPGNSTLVFDLHVVYVGR